jgi:ACT domain-containing protein
LLLFFGNPPSVAVFFGKAVAFFRAVCYNQKIKGAKRRFAARRFPQKGHLIPKRRRIMKAVISVTGRDTIGIISGVSDICSRRTVNILDISQTVLQEYFSMIMLVDIDRLSVPFPTFVDELSALGKEKGLEIHTMHENIFNSMHRI